MTIEELLDMVAAAVSPKEAAHAIGLDDGELSSVAWVLAGQYGVPPDQAAAHLAIGYAIGCAYAKKIGMQ